MTFYEEQAITRNVPLFAGIGASQIDRNSISDMGMAKESLKATSIDYVDTIKNVAKSISEKGYDNRNPPWPGTVYFEDISSESDFELIEVIVEAALSEGALELPNGQP